MFIQTEETPNPATLKFLPGRTVMEEGTADFTSAESALGVLLAEKLFSVTGVKGVFLGKDFISITKSDDGNWLTLRPSILTVIMDYFLSHGPVTPKVMPASTTSDEDHSDVVREIREIIETRIRPAVARDGGDIVLDRFENGIVFVRLQGACSGCPSSTATLKSGIENMLRHYIPEVEEVRAVL